MKGYNKFVLAVYVVLMIYSVYVVVIYDDICMGDTVNILCEVIFHENMAKVM